MISTQGLDETISRFLGMPGAQHQKFVRAMHDATALVQQQARANIARMFANPAKMQAAVESRVDDSATSITGTIFASGLPYLAIHEYGGVVHTPEIFPVNAQALHWLSPSGLGFSGGPTTQGGVFAMHTRAHDTRIPERSYMRAALAQKRSEIIALFTGAAVP